MSGPTGRPVRQTVKELFGDVDEQTRMALAAGRVGAMGKWWRLMPSITRGSSAAALRVVQGGVDFFSDRLGPLWADQAGQGDEAAGVEVVDLVGPDPEFFFKAEVSGRWAVGRQPRPRRCRGAPPTVRTSCAAQPLAVRR